MSILSIINRFRRFLRRENFDRLLLAIVVLILISTVGLTLFEPDITFIDAFWWSIVTLTTVGYGDISPASFGGRVIAITLMLFGIGLLGMLSATIASILVHKKIKEDRGMNTYNFEDHIILCEWNHQSQIILNDFRADPQTEEAMVVLIADIEHKPVNDEYLFFIQGHVNDDTLKRANLAKARTVIVLGDAKLDDTSRDAKVVLTTLTIESINPDAYTIVELVNKANVRHCQRANADEIIVSSELSSNLIARAALNHGITKVVSEVLQSGEGNELYKIPILSTMVGQPFIDVFMEMKQENNCTVLAVQKGEEGQVISNPSKSYQLQKNDYLIVIALEVPQGMGL